MTGNEPAFPTLTRYPNDTLAFEHVGISTRLYIATRLVAAVADKFISIECSDTERDWVLRKCLFAADALIYQDQKTP